MIAAFDRNLKLFTNKNNDQGPGQRSDDTTP